MRLLHDHLRTSHSVKVENPIPHPSLILQVSPIPIHPYLILILLFSHAPYFIPILHSHTSFSIFTCIHTLISDTSFSHTAYFILHFHMHSYSHIPYFVLTYPILHSHIPPYLIPITCPYSDWSFRRTRPLPLAVTAVEWLPPVTWRSSTRTSWKTTRSPSQISHPHPITKPHPLRPHPPHRAPSSHSHHTHFTTALTRAPPAQTTPTPAPPSSLSPSRHHMTVT